ncbi:R-spondin-4 [Pristis pectinata]|uniref:R-spondin-4 n=1 Tax=Pristis pectinata TaxID=685728 RepID=UPI00223DB4B3|nr:R-spondin-4 [Pristis pectinata]
MGRGSDCQSRVPGPSGVAAGPGTVAPASEGGSGRRPTRLRRAAHMDLRALVLGIVLLGCWQRAGAEDKGLLQKCRSCQDCSVDNGCLSCQHRLFLLIKREGIRQHGECVHVCPVGHYSLRGKDANRCLRCKATNCETCFSREFCIKCSPDHYLLKGKCYTACPKGSAPQVRLMECVDGCKVGPWSEWSPCMRNQRTCGYKWGSESRSRQELSPSLNRSEPCVALTMSRKCRIKKRHCPGDKKVHKTRGNKWKKKGLANGKRSEEFDDSS